MPDNNGFMEFLKSSLAQEKIQSEFAQRQVAGWRAFATLLAVILLAVCLVFAGTVFYMTFEHGKQIAALANIEVELKERVVQDGKIEGAGSNAQLSQTQNVGKPEK